MSILIKGMQIPENCTKCGLMCALRHFNILNDNRPDDCPLIELPEHHGDLVDVNDIRWDDHYDSDGNLSKYKIAYSDEMPDPVIKGE